MGKEEEKRPEQIEIKFGMVFERVYGKKTSRWVVTQMGQDSDFFGAPISIFEGKESIRGSGTLELKDIHKVTGEYWSLEQVLNAYDIGFRIIGGAPEEFVNLIKLEADKPPRILTS
jgi:hypothetical protein